MIVDVGTPYRLAQATVLLLAFVVLALTVIWMRRHPMRALYGVPTMVWMVHIIIFYLAVFAAYYGWFDVPGDDQTFYTKWSITLRIHGIITLLAYEMRRYLHDMWRKRIVKKISIGDETS